MENATFAAGHVTQAEIDSHQWFHGLDFGDGRRAKGRGRPENWSIYGVLSFMEGIDFAGLDVLDVGTMDGLIPFIAEKEGARRVVATDLYDRKSFRLAWRIFNSNVRYEPNTSIETLISRHGPASFDVVVMGGLLYHLMSPLRAFLIARTLLRTGGLLLLETVASKDEEPNLRFNLSGPVIDEYTTYFVASPSAVQGMARFSGFRIEASAASYPANAEYSRYSIAARAVGSDALESDCDLMTKAITRATKADGDQITDELSLRAALANPVGVRTPTFTMTGHTDISPAKFQTRFALQPRG